MFWYSINLLLIFCGIVHFGDLCNFPYKGECHGQECHEPKYCGTTDEVKPFCEDGYCYTATAAMQVTGTYQAIKQLCENNGGYLPMLKSAGLVAYIGGIANIEGDGYWVGMNCSGYAGEDNFDEVCVWDDGTPIEREPGTNRFKGTFIEFDNGTMPFYYSNFRHQTRDPTDDGYLVCIERTEENQHDLAPAGVSRSGITQPFCIDNYCYVLTFHNITFHSYEEGKQVCEDMESSLPIIKTPLIGRIISNYGPKKDRRFWLGLECSERSDGETAQEYCTWNDGTEVDVEAGILHGSHQVWPVSGRYFAYDYDTFAGKFLPNETYAQRLVCMDSYLIEDCNSGI